MFKRQLAQHLIRTFIYNSTKRTYANICQSYQLSLLKPALGSGCLHHQTLRFKSKKSQRQQAAGSTTEPGTEEERYDDKVVDKTTKIMQITVKSTRIDLVLKSGLGMARNKIETLFYDSKIRVNGKKLLKKSDLAQEGDEIDIVKGASGTNPDFLSVARVEVLAISEKGDNLSVKIRRCKNLDIEKYEDYAKK